MLKVTLPQKTRRRYLGWLVVPISLAAHVGFLSLSETWSTARPREYGTSQVRFTAPPPPPPPPVEEPLPEPPPKKVVDLTKKPKKAEPPAPPPEPMPNQELPPEEPPAEPAPAVFGVTADSVVAGTGGPSIRVGNTLAKKMEHAYTDREAVKPLPPAPPPRKKVPPKPVPTYELTEAPSFRDKVEPEYPQEERAQGVEGTVRLEVLIDARGKVRKVRVLEAPTKALALAAVRALKQSHFRPGMIDDTPVPVKVNIPYRFVLNG